MQSNKESNERYTDSHVCQKEYVTWQQVDEFVDRLYKVVEERDLHFSGVYGVPRGGLTLGVCVSHALDIPLLLAPAPGCLIVDDIVDTGRTLDKYKNLYPIACMYFKQNNLFEPVFWCYEKTDTWIEFPWERKLVEDKSEDNEKEDVQTEE